MSNYKPLISLDIVIIKETGNLGIIKQVYFRTNSIYFVEVNKEYLEQVYNRNELIRIGEL